MRLKIESFLSLLLIFFISSIYSSCISNSNTPVGDKDNGGLFLPDGFEALVVVDSLGHARHLAVNNNGNIYVKLTNTKKDSGNVALGDFKNGRAGRIEYFGDYPSEKGYGPTSMRIYNGYIYFGAKGAVYRQKLTPGDLVPQSKIEMVLRNTDTTEHLAKVIAFDDNGNMYVNYGSLSNACQVENRVPESPGKYPCPELSIHAGIWKFDANQTNLNQTDGARYATGLRDGIAMDWNHSTNSLFVVEHGRDDLHKLWPLLYSEWESALLPSEEFFEVKEGMDGGWPYFYYDQIQGKKIISPEYLDVKGLENSEKNVTKPLIGFPGHWAPNDLLFYTGDQFPEHYKNGAFIAFQGGGGRSPYSQSGYFVCFVPFENGVPAKSWEVFADGFSGKDTLVNSSDALHRPMGLAQGPDGSLYVSDINTGKIWRIMFKGNKENFGKKQLDQMEGHKEVAHIRTPDEIKDNLESEITNEGQKLYNTYCSSCHQSNAKGIAGRYPPLSPSEWVTGDKSKLIEVLLNGLTGPITVNGESFDGVMPQQSFLGNNDIAKILTFLRRSFGNAAGAVEEKEVSHVRTKIGKN